MVVVGWLEVRVRLDHPGPPRSTRERVVDGAISVAGFLLASSALVIWVAAPSR
jgi:hypothetical protein